MSKSLHDNIDDIESGYEYLLAYAAQGRESDEGSGGSEVRTTLTSMAQAATHIAAELREIFREVAASVAGPAQVKKRGAPAPLALTALGGGEDPPETSRALLALIAQGLAEPRLPIEA